MTHEHLNDEQLSAHLDGVPYGPPPDTAASGETLESEIAGCDRCRHRLAVLAQARALVGLPVVAVSPSVRAAAVAAALADAPADRPGPDSTAPTTLRSSSSPRPTGALIGAAAAAAVLIVGVGLALGLSHGRSPTTTSAAVAAGSHSTPTVREPQKSVTTGTGGLADLGSVGSPASLRSRVTALLASKSGDQEALPVASSSPAGSGVPGNSSDEAGTAQTPAAATAACAAAAEQSGSQPSAGQPSGAPTSTTTAGSFTVVATVTYRGTPALVAVQGSGSSSGAATPRVVVVLARTGCRVVARTTL
jgi:hypothetical protein